MRARILMKNENNLYNDEFDFGNIIQVLWHNKLIVIVFIICSIPLSVNYIRSINAEYVSEAVIQNNESRKNNQIPSMGSRGLTLGLLESISSTSLDKSGYISKLTSKKFIKTIINDDKELKSKLDIYCPSLNNDDYIYETPSPYSLAGIMTSLGISDKYIEPDNNQLIDQVINCVQEMIEIEPYKYKTKKTDAIRIEARTRDPVFSSILVNEIVEKYISSETKDKEEEIDKINSYWSEKIADAKLSLDVAIQNFQNFTKKNAALLAPDEPFFKLCLFERILDRLFSS